MRTIPVEELSRDAFWQFGSYAQTLDPAAEKIGEAPIEFFRDLAQLNLGGAPLASFSTVRVQARDWIVDVSEVHSRTGEGILPLDGDVLIHVGPATPGGEGVPLDKIRAFRVPQGAFVALRPGVWHHAPISVSGRPANVLIVLPERTYANDCVVVNLPEQDRIRIQPAG